MVYCTRCRRHTDDTDSSIAITKNGMKRLCCKCRVCGTNKSSFLPKNQADKKQPVQRAKQTRNVKSNKIVRTRIPKESDFDEYTGEGLKEWMSEVGRRWRGVKMAVKGERTNLKPAVRELLANHGDKKIRSIMVCRKPLNKNLGKIVEIYRKIRGMDEMKQHDQYFHLYLVSTLEDGTRLALEKNQDINAKIYQASDIDQCIDINLNRGDLTPNLLFDNAKKVMGDSFYRYDALENNCQLFVMHLLNDSLVPISTEQKDFIYQPVEGLLDTFGQRVVRAITSSFNRLTTAVQGEGLD